MAEQFIQPTEGYTGASPFLTTGDKQELVEASEMSTEPLVKGANEKYTGPVCLPITESYSGPVESPTGRVSAPRTILRGIKEDIKSGETVFERGRTATVGTLALGVQVVDRFRVGVVLTAHTATELLERTGMNDAERIGTAALGAAVVNFAWNTGVSESFRYGLREYPRTVRGFKEVFPSFVRLFESSLPGMKQTASSSEVVTRTEPEQEKGAAKRVRDSASFHTRRAASGMSLGPTAYVATASTQERPDKEIRNIGFGVNTDVAVMVGTVVAGAGKGITELARNGHAQLATNLQNVLSDSKFWWGVAGASMVAEYIGNRRASNNLDEENSQ